MIKSKQFSGTNRLHTPFGMGKLYRRGLVLVAICAIILSSNPAKAQEIHGFGLSAGFASGFGFSYRNMPLHGIGYQPSAIYIKTDKLTLSSLGLQGLYVLSHTTTSALYAVAGFGNLYKKTTKEVTVNDGLFNEHKEDVVTTINRNAIGLGMGYSYRYPGSDKLWTSLELLLTSYRGDIFPYPQVAMHYFF